MLESNKKDKAQVIIEFSVAVLVLFLFLFGSLKIFLWFNKCLRERQDNYEVTRLWAGSTEIMREPILEDAIQLEKTFNSADGINPYAALWFKPHLVDGFYKEAPPWRDWNKLDNYDLHKDLNDPVLEQNWMAGHRRAKFSYPYGLGLEHEYKDLKIFKGEKKEIILE